MNVKFTQFFKQLSSFENRVKNLPNVIHYGRLISINGLVLEVSGLKIPIGSECSIERVIEGKTYYIDAEVIGFSGEKTLLLSFEEHHGILPGTCVFLKISSNPNFFLKKIPLGMPLLGRVLDGRGYPLDGLPPLHDKYYRAQKIQNNINPLHRKPITEVLDTGIRSINALLTIGKGQKIGIFSSSGLGKSILIGMIAKYTQADVIVIALIGERGREVKNFIEKILGSEGLSRSIVVASPSDTSPLIRIKAASYATSISEYFCKKNKHVLLIMDSLTRYAMAEQEVSLSLGELPVSKGYPSSIFSKITNLVERVGNISEKGTISAFYTILTDSDDEQDPVSHMARSILDGHIILSRYYADLGHYPAIDIESSISRVMPEIINFQQRKQSSYFKKLFSSYQRNRDLINVGAYITGSDLVLDHAIKLWPKLEKFLQQEISENSSYSVSCDDLNQIFL